MLVLTRKQTETIQIGDNIVIKVIQTGRGSIKIGIEAPADVRILRGEVAEAATSLDTNGPAKPSMQVDHPFPQAGKMNDPVFVGAV